MELKSFARFSYACAKRNAVLVPFITSINEICEPTGTLMTVIGNQNPKDNSGFNIALLMEKSFTFIQNSELLPTRKPRKISLICKVSKPNSKAKQEENKKLSPLVKGGQGGFLYR